MSEPASSPSALPSPSSASRRPARILVIDWLRGLAVVLMILAHVYDSWLDPAYKTGAAWSVIRHLAGLPSRLFLFLVGVSAAIVFESQLARGISTKEMRQRAFKRGLLVLALAYLFRLQEHVLALFWGGWMQVLRVDILNCIGASLLVLALVAIPRNGRPSYLAALLTAAIFVGLGHIVGPAHFPDWIPKPISSYVGGQRPLAWFPLFPWGAWALVGLVIGHLWLRHGRDLAGQARTFLVTGAVGAVLSASVIIIRTIDPVAFRYPSELIQQMGPAAFFYRLGLIAMMAWLGWQITRSSGTRYSPLRQLGQTSLLIYWVHIEIVYGFGTRFLQKKLSLAGTTLGFAAMVALMYALSVFKTQHRDRMRAWFDARLLQRRPRTVD